MISTMPLKTFPNATPRPMMAGFTDVRRSATKSVHHFDLKPALALSCSVVMALAASKTNGVRPGRARRMPSRARVKMASRQAAGCATRRPNASFSLT
ncbi:hypothetical protein HXP45_28965 [Streptomyces actuosus]|nr:hypothetical protein [Streptomyces actuosus]